MPEQETKCKCDEIMAKDPTRHFRGCPKREEFPTHPAQDLREMLKGGEFRKLEIPYVIGPGFDVESRHFLDCETNGARPCKCEERLFEMTHKRTELKQIELKAQPDDALLAEAIEFLTSLNDGYDYTENAAETKRLVEKFKRIRDQAKANERALVDMLRGERK